MKTSAEKKEQAIRFRESGMSIKNIAAELEVSAGTAHLLVRNVPVTEEMRQKIVEQGKLNSARKIREQTKARKTQLGLTSLTAKVDENYDPKGIGDKSTAQILAAFLVADMKVLTPFGDRFRYDLVVDEDGRFVRVQCKTAKFKGDGFEFSCCSNNWNSGKVTSYRGQCEVFAIYLRETQTVYVFKVDGCPAKTCTVRLVEGWQKKGVRMAEANEFKTGKSLLDYP